ncbi:hypothetical protein ACIGT4_30765 [Streptomyces sioyaensis]|uniref:hypothetical protein n=1 Tax=Streptomyces sioyaensis TaxID=67364 RepID=UPI0037D8B9A7
MEAESRNDAPPHTNALSGSVAVQHIGVQQLPRAGAGVESGEPRAFASALRRA